MLKIWQAHNETFNVMYWYAKYLIDEVHNWGAESGDGDDTVRRQRWEWWQITNTHHHGDEGQGEAWTHSECCGREGASILQLLSGKNQTLLVKWVTLLVLNLGFHVIDGVLRLDLQRNGLHGESFDKDLHTATEMAENETQSGML